MNNNRNETIYNEMIPNQTISNQTIQNQINPLSKPAIMITLAVIATLLWGSAFPSVKIGYQLFQISADDTWSKLLFAGCRFALAGFATLLVSSLIRRKPAVPSRDSIGLIAGLGLLQTATQYFFFYISLSHTTGVKGSILDSSGTFFAVLAAHFFRTDDRLNWKKTAGCLMGLAGIVLINLNGQDSLSGGFSFTGEGFMLLAAAAFGFSFLISKAATERCDPVTVTGYQLLIGGGVLALTGLLLGGRLTPSGPSALLLFAYLVAISAVPFTLWTILLKYNPVGKVAILNFLTPLFGVILSGLLLGEDFLSLKTLISLLLVCLGIYIVEKPSKNY